MRHSSITAIAWSLLLVLGSLAIKGCESDPILSPPTEEEQDRGSYGISRFTFDPSSPDPDPKDNPELF